MLGVHRRTDGRTDRRTESKHHSISPIHYVHLADIKIEIYHIILGFGLLKIEILFIAKIYILGDSQEICIKMYTISNHRLSFCYYLHVIKVG